MLTICVRRWQTELVYFNAAQVFATKGAAILVYNSDRSPTLRLLRYRVVQSVTTTPAKVELLEGNGVSALTYSFESTLLP